MGVLRFGLFLLVILFSAAPVQAQQLFVEDIRYGSQAGKTRIVMDFSAPTDFRAFLLESPWRLAVDVQPAGWKTVKNSQTSRDMIKGYRSGALAEENLTRIVFDLRQPAAVTRAFTLEKSATAKDRVVIDLQPASENLARAQLNAVYGNRGLKSRAAAALPPPASGWAAAANAQMSAIPLPARKPAFVPTRARKRTVVIDAGHGGGDPGAATGHVREKNITLAVARELKRQLDETGRYNAVLTRDRDVYVRLRERMALSRREKGDLFISIHADKIGRKDVRGASIYTLSENASDAETERLAESENNAGVVAGVDLAAESADVADILLDLAMREKMNESSLLARIMVQALRRADIRLLPNAHRSAGFAVLKAPDVPAILIETGFLSNPQEAGLLNSSAFQRRIAGAMLAGVENYFQKMQELHRAE